jgi:hypothetical protein
MKNFLKSFVILSLGTIATTQAQSLLHSNFSISHQSSLINPAVMPDAKFEITLPTNFYFRAGNTDVTLGDLFRKDTDFGSNLTKAANSLDGKERIFFNFMMEGLYVGIKVKEMHVSFGAYVNSDISIDGFSGPLKLGLNGNAAFIDKPLDLSSFGANVLNTLVYHTGFSMDAPFMEGLRLGARLKFITGIQHVAVENNAFTLETDKDTYYLNIESDFIARTAGIDNPEGTMLEQILGAKNRGFGIDLGGTYEYSDKLTFNASVTDLGKINWKNGVAVFRNDNASFTYEGTFYDLEGENEVDFDAVLDSLKEALLPNKSSESYSSSLYTKMSVGGKYQFTDRVSADVLLYGKLLAGKMEPAFYLGGTYALTKGLQFRATYYARPGYLFNWNAGIAANLLFAQAYLVIDNGHALLNVPNAKNIGVQFGLSFGNFRDNDKKGMDSRKLLSTKPPKPKRQFNFFKKKTE